MDYMSIIACIPIGRANRITRERLSRLTGKTDRIKGQMTLYELEELIKLKTEVFNNAQQDT